MAGAEDRRTWNIPCASGIEASKAQPAKAEGDVIFFKQEGEAKGVRVMTEAFGGGESLARYACAKGVVANTSFVWLPANEGTFWGATMDDLQKWLVKHPRTPQAEPKPQQVGAK